MSRQPSDLDLAYSPSTCVDSLDDLLGAYAEQSARARAEHPPATHRYGALPCETLDVFHAGSPAPAHVFIHGGYWQELSKDDSSFPAPGFLRAGISYVAIDYGLAPEFTLDQIVEQARSALAWLWHNAAELGIDATRVVLSGSSAGAHLAAMAALADWPARGCPAGWLGGLALLSGIYDLAPLVSTYVNDAVGMDLDTARRNSPLALASRLTAPAVIAWGEHETAAFKEQSAAFAGACETAGAAVTRLEAAGRNHFDIVHDLSEVETPLGAAVARLHHGLPAAG